MTDFTFPRMEVHRVDSEAGRLIMGPFAGGFTLTDEVGADLIEYCPEKSVEECKEWVKGRFGARWVGAVDELESLVSRGFFNSLDAEVRPIAPLDPTVNLVVLCLTHRCQLACPYCCVRDARSGAVGDMPFETACTAVNFFMDQIAGSDQRRLEIGFTITGEPLLTLGLMLKVADYATRQAATRGVDLGMAFTTNGVLLDAQVFQRCIDAGIDRDFMLSWSGPADIHDAHRVFPDGSGPHRYVVNAFETIRKQWRNPDAPEGPIISAVVSAAQPNVSAVFQHLFDNGARRILIKPVRDVGSELSVSESSLPAFKAAYSDFAESLLKTDAYHTERLCALLPADYFARFLHRVARNGRVTQRCTRGASSVVVDVNGDIHACLDFVGMPEYRIGDVFTGFDNESRQPYLEGLCCQDLVPCRACWARYWCGGGCVPQSVKAFGRLDAPYPADCELIKHIIELSAYTVTRLNKERPSLLAHVFTFDDPEPLPDPRPVALCRRVDGGGLWGRPLTDWRYPDPILLNDAGQAGGFKKWGGPEDLSASIYLRWGDDYFYAFAELRDDVFAPPSAINSEWWFYDSLQVALDPLNDGGASADWWKLTGDDCEFGLAWIRGRSVCYDCHVDRSKASVRWRGTVERRGNLTMYKMAIPWRCMPAMNPASGVEFGFTAVVNDCDGAGRGWLQWTPGITRRKRPGAFGLLRLV